MIPIGILEIGKSYIVKTKFGDKSVVKVRFEQEDTKKQHTGSMFIPKEGLPDYFVVGGECVADVEVNGQYTNIKHIEPFGEKPSIKKMYDQEVKKQEVPQEPEIPLKKEPINRDASIVAQVCLKVKAESGGYRDSEGLPIENMNEKIYDDYIFFLNRITPND
jgi:hypothetical protein